jgi:CubicO group peptidase (beta-lactamase class C family)
MAMRRRRVTLAGTSVVAVVATASLLCARDGSALATSAGPRELFAAVDHVRAQQPFSGSLLVVKDGRVFAARAYGFADRTRHRRARLDTRYRISGLTEAFTWIALLQLRDRHLLDLDASVCVYLHPCPRSWRPLTPHLLGPSSGLHALRRIDFAHWPPTLAQYVRRLRREALYFKPGSQLAYNTSPYFGGESPSILAARLLEIISGKPWMTYVRAHILRPAGMTSTRFARSRRDAIGYGRRRDGVIVRLALPQPTVSPPVVSGFWSTVGDMARLDRALQSGKLLSAQSLAELDTPALARDRRRGRGWNCCWLVTEQFGHRAQVHGAHGSGDGFYSALERYPRDGVVVLVFTNFGGSGPAFAVADLAASMALGEYPVPVAVDATILRRSTGVFVYRERRGARRFSARMTLTYSGSGLRVSKASRGFEFLRGPLLSVSDSVFVPRYTPTLRLDFVRDSAGDAVKVIVRNVNAGWKIEFRYLAGRTA